MTDSELRKMALECGAKHPMDWIGYEELRFGMAALQAFALRIEAQALRVDATANPHPFCVAKVRCSMGTQPGTLSVSFAADIEGAPV